MKKDTTTKHYTVEQVLKRAAQLDIMLGVEGETLNIYAPRGALTEKIRAVLREYKPELVVYLKEQERRYLQQHQEPPLCATCLDLDRDHPVEALPEPHIDDFYYCKRHHPVLQQERGDSHE